MKYREINIDCGCTIAETVEKLLFFKEAGELVCAAFNGHMLYSDTVTLDNAYLEITGKTKTEWDKEREEERIRRAKEKEEFQAKIPVLIKEWTEKGHEILNEKYWLEWELNVPFSLRGIYQGMDLEDCLEIIKALNTGSSLSDAKQIFYDQNHSGTSYHLVLSMVKDLCDRGADFEEFCKSVSTTRHIDEPSMFS